MEFSHKSARASTALRKPRDCQDPAAVVYFPRVAEEPAKITVDPIYQM